MASSRPRVRLRSSHPFRVDLDPDDLHIRPYGLEPFRQLNVVDAEAP